MHQPADSAPLTAFLRVAAIASFASAATTLVLIFAPDFYAPAEGFAGRMMRVVDPAYQVRAWAYLFHPLMAFTAALGVALCLRRTVLALAGALGFALWAAVEAAQQTLTLFAFDRWRRAWLAGDAAVRETMVVRTAIYDGLWDASYVLLLIGFVAGCTCFAAAMVGLRGLTRIVGVFFGAAAVLGAINLGAEIGLPPVPEPLATWLYAAVQPLGRALVGVWLWRVARERLQARA